MLGSRLSRKVLRMKSATIAKVTYRKVLWTSVIAVSWRFIRARAAASWG